ncbi:MAG: concentrative nucleoside transporter, family [Nocardioidaceae bacterium]|nr:concentrative nucleoside transporter, family [Nocardioidaceae bacterium]
MQHLRGLLGLVFLLAVAFAFSKNRKGIAWRTVVGALLLQAGFAALVLRWGPGRDALSWVSGRVTTLIGYTNQGTAFVFGPLTAAGSKNQTIFALQVLPVIVFLGALIGLLFYLRVIQFATYVIGGAISWALRVTKIESLFAATVIFLGQSEAPLMIAPYLRGLTTAQMFTVMTSGFAAASGSTLVGYSLLGAPLKYLLAATVMNAPAGLLMAKLVWPDSTEEKAARAEGPDASGRSDRPDGEVAAVAAGRGGRSGASAAATSAGDVDVRTVRDEESANAIDALGRGALAGGRIAVTVGALLIAFVALIALSNGILSGVGGWFGVDNLTFQRLVGWAFAPLAWLLGVPWSEAVQAGSYMGQKTVLNEFVAYASFGPHVHELSSVTVVIVTFALAGFANFASIAIQIGTIASLQPDRRAQVARLGLTALLAGSLANLANAAIAGIIAST